MFFRVRTKKRSPGNGFAKGDSWKSEKIVRGPCGHRRSASKPPGGGDGDHHPFMLFRLPNIKVPPMSGVSSSPFNDVIGKFRAAQAERAARDREYEACRETLTNGWRLHDIPPILVDLNTALQRNSLNLRVEAGACDRHPEAGGPFISYAMTRPSPDFESAAAFPELRIQLHEHMAAYTNIEDESGETYVLRLDDRSGANQLTSVFASYLRICLETI